MVANQAPHHSVVHKGVTVCRLVLYLMHDRDKVETMKKMEMVVLLDGELYKYNNSGSQLSIWELSLKILLV